MRFSQAYTSGDERCGHLLKRQARAASDREAAVRDAATRRVPDAVLAALERHSATGDACRAHLDVLARGGAAAVLTGQQVGLFLGPLYTVYKAASAVVAARALQSACGVPVVPIFWLQTEDHDFDEVATTWIPQGAAEPRPLRVEAPDASPISMAHRRFDPAIDEVIAELEATIGNLPHAAATLDVIRRHYHVGATWPDAFAGWLRELFGPSGLLVIDPRDRGLAAAAAPVHRRAIASADVIARGLDERCARLTELGFDTQVYVRPGAPLSFFHPDGPEGPRHRLDRDGDVYTVVGGEGRSTASTLLAELESNPRAFSTSALLRPILQDTWFPTAAYVGGPGEIDYFAQMGPVYEAFDLPMPVIVPRARFTIVETRTARTLQSLNLTADDAAAPLDELLKKASGGATRRGRAALEAELVARMKSALDEAAPAWRGLGGLERAHAKTAATIEGTIQRFTDKYERAVLHEDEDRVDRARRIRWALQPNDAPQERVFGLPYFAARYSAERVVEDVLARCRPFEGALQEITW
ncbi:MAG: bacillithiol biosynthesis cysteine-adding enzyme BshC [Deltaproteobacteria bacterium]|jgi:bacillithiol biosynthesis cysteine-adding enzyme BshC